MTTKSESDVDRTKKVNVPEASLSRETEERIELNVLLKFIKPFDGSRSKLNSFISNCLNAHNLASKPQKPILFRYILSQLIDKAESICGIKEFETFEQFIEFLKQQFGEKKHYAHLLSELQECKQIQNETVNQYALKVETILSKLLTETKITIKKKSEIPGRVAAMEDLALHTFTIGLHPRLSQIVRCRNPDSLNSAISFAVAEEKILATYKKTTLPNPIGIEKPKFNPRREYTTPQSYRTPRQDTRYDQSKRVNANDLVCRYCKNIGHSIENCRKRQYNNSRNQSIAPSNRQNPTRGTFTLTQQENDSFDTTDNNNLNE